MPVNISQNHELRNTLWATLMANYSSLHNLAQITRSLLPGYLPALPNGSVSQNPGFPVPSGLCPRHSLFLPLPGQCFLLSRRSPARQALLREAVPANAMPPRLSIYPDPLVRPPPALAALQTLVLFPFRGRPASHSSVSLGPTPCLGEGKRRAVHRK